MSQFTLTVKQLVENDVKLFNFDYPIFDEEYRSYLENKITRHFYFREIGFETVGRFLYHLETKMNEIMPYYNQLYHSTLLEFNPLINYQVTETQSRDVKARGVGNETGNGKGLYSDTPQGRTSLEGTNHVTEINQSSTSSITENDSESSEKYVRTMEGNIGVQTFSSLINDYRTTFINVDMMVIDELNELFMRIY